MKPLLSAHDRRQLILICKQLSFYKEGKLDLGSLVARLEGLLEIIESVDISWKELFRSEWANLEVAYADLLYKGYSKLDPFGQDIVNQTINNLNNMVLITLKNSIKSCLDNPDPSIKMALSIDNEWLMCSECSDAWKSSSHDAMIICPKCGQLLHNPSYQKTKE